MSGERQSVSEGGVSPNFSGSAGMRRICLKTCDSKGKKQVFTLAPSGVMPYFVGYTDEVEKGLFLRRFDVPFWALAYVFGQDDNYWHRMENRFGRYEIVQSGVKNPEKLPLHLLADEKITWLNGEKVVVATTVGEDCVLGVSVALNADEENLTEAYQPMVLVLCHTCFDR